MDDETVFTYSIMRCIDNITNSLVHFVRVVPIRAINTTTKYKIVQLGNHILSYININDETIYQNMNQGCNDNIIHSLVTFSRVVSLPEINNTTMYKIVSLSLELYPWNCKGNHMLLHMNMNMNDAT